VSYKKLIKRSWGVHTAVQAAAAPQVKPSSVEREPGLEVVMQVGLIHAYP